MNAFFSAVQRFAGDEDGITAIEYGLIAALMAAGIGGLTTLLLGATDTVGLRGAFQQIATVLNAA
ncbi:pilus assembly protein Flp/PilA [Janthinobacterium sp. CG_23.3]|uniref:Flp family type IVb pilin n=1 Tax=Janthinobacterium sp. CG_23.3 TaxID=3349634 RepID=UPI0038D4241C